jgi:ribose transport system ATP-binding protein
LTPLREGGNKVGISGPLLLHMDHIHKSFPGVKALDDVSFDLRCGEVHALVGENGAGKSTLIKILGGVYIQDQGRISISGGEVAIREPSDALRNGISIIFQEFSLVPVASVAENIFLGIEPRKGRLGIYIDRKKMFEEAQKLLNDIGKSNIPGDMPVERLTIAQQQIVEIIKALNRRSRILVMDEPTAVLTQEETETLFEIVTRLKNNGTSIVYISHRLDEIFRICDRATVLRDGRRIDTVAIREGQVSKDDLIRMMVGRDLGNLFCIPARDLGSEICLRIEHLTRKGEFSDVNFTLKKGEILGFSGLVGAGRTEVMKSLFGLNKPDNGTIEFYGKKAVITSPQDAIDLKFGFVPEDRKREGLVLMHSMKTNVTQVTMRKYSRMGFLNDTRQVHATKEYIKKLNIKPPLPERDMKDFSGGNQQKAVIAKWLDNTPELLILDEPTRGVDVGAKQEIYAIIKELADSGVSIIVVSSEMEEILGLCDRVIVMHEGQIQGEFSRGEATQEKLLYAASGN